MTDYLRGTTITNYGGDRVVGPESGLHAMYQQANIISGLKQRLESSLFEIRTLVQGDLFDSELDTARELNSKGFPRGAGMVAGVVLEGHLAAVCDRRNQRPKKKNPTISDFNDALKESGTIEVSTWRFIQHLGDVRNKCGHKKDSEPTAAEVRELIDGVGKISKTVF